jgi:hypothetical protein
MKSFALFLMGFATTLALLGINQMDLDHMVKVPEEDTVPYEVTNSLIEQTVLLDSSDFTYFMIHIPGAELLQKRKGDTTLMIEGDTLELIRYMIDVLTTPKVPTVLINDGDTSRFYGGDTLRVTSCGSNGFEWANNIN